MAVLLNVFWFYNLWAVTCSCRPPDVPCSELLFELQQANSHDKPNRNDNKTMWIKLHGAPISIHSTSLCAVDRAWQSNSVYRTDYVSFQAKLAVLFSTVRLSRNFGSLCELWVMLLIWFFSCSAQFSGVEGMIKLGSVLVAALNCDDTSGYKCYCWHLCVHSLALLGKTYRPLLTCPSSNC